MAEGIGPGDEVITTPYSFVATANVILRLGAEPVFVDIDYKSMNINPALISDAITDRTRAIIPVDLFGQPCDLDEICSIAKKNNLVVIEDAAQAIGASYHNKPVGSISDYTCFSFFPTKNLGCCGDGGAILTQSNKIAARLRMLRAHGAVNKHEYDMLGGNFRLDALQAAILSAKLPYLAEWNRNRMVNATNYCTRFMRLVDEGFITAPSGSADRTHVYNQYVIRAQFRDDLRTHLATNGVGTEIYYPIPLHKQVCFSAYPIIEQSEICADTSLAIPIFPGLTKADINRIVNTIEKFFNLEPIRS